MDYSIESRDGFLEVKQTGAGDCRVYVGCTDSVLDHGSWSPGIPVLLDQTELDAGPLTVYDVRVIADHCGARRREIGASRLAVLVGRDLEFGMNRMWSVFVEDQWDVVVALFRSRDEAVAWLTCD